MWLIGFIGFRVIGITSDLCGGSRAYGTRGFHGALKGLYRPKDSSLHPEGSSFVLLRAKVSKLRAMFLTLGSTPTGTNPKVTKEHFVDPWTIHDGHGFKEDLVTPTCRWVAFRCYTTQLETPISAVYGTCI